MESTDSVSQHSSENETKKSGELSEFSKKATALTLCYLMLIYYMDRFCIAGKKRDHLIPLATVSIFDS